MEKKFGFIRVGAVVPELKISDVTFNDLVYLVNNGIINDANGIIAIEAAKKYLRKQK